MECYILPNEELRIAMFNPVDLDNAISRDETLDNLNNTTYDFKRLTIHINDPCYGKRNNGGEFIIETNEKFTLYELLSFMKHIHDSSYPDVEWCIIGFTFGNGNCYPIFDYNYVH